MEEDYFADTYQEAREKFLKAAKAAGAKIESLELKGQKGPEGETLAIDIAVLGDVNNSNPESLLLHTSGVHGKTSHIPRPIFRYQRYIRIRPGGICGIGHPNVVSDSTREER